jgi:hypothetical protein
LDKSRQNRKKYSEILNILTLAEFDGDLDEFNQHLEFMEDVTYRLTTEPESKQIVDEEVEKYVHTHRAKFEAARRRKDVERGAARRAAKQAAMDVDEPSPAVDVSVQVNQAPGLLAPIPIPQKTQPSAMERIKSPDPVTLTPKSQANRKRMLLAKPVISRNAGGFRKTYDSTRIQQDTYQSLFFFN